MVMETYFMDAIYAMMSVPLHVQFVYCLLQYHKNVE
jgi:hypothetical protein